MRHSLASISPGFGGGGGSGGDSSINSSPRYGTNRQEGRERGPGPKTHSGVAGAASSEGNALPLSRRGGDGRARATAVPGPRPALPFSPSGEKGGRGPERLDGKGHAGAASPCALGVTGVRCTPPGGCCGSGCCC
uniref:collagen alpha-1(I) chain-like n=1 Tax=Ictidomys tridecemlineatus TaxID=43179 RepID=UPI001A9CE0E4|nr:collagen alpha-1(I) chain-like [Ictidomys tridecemlineatus]XP_040139183.1 collagen alpha-1(I) chain-like [Ictidomys tridecemlineatus]XP_040139185.1 collagen alpha-1(I) chain-like [Ictidomys tridecemlineatus]XP_040139186.1 collagen alpha-1(I) chain-like [Ictidomys tridecemlineatus]XP_040139187.1 collagen alpha-1(I) chain-like [Ictidomys tridecemlineatus]